jgi:DNA-binding CsgD family transcriptional regulator
MTTDPTHDSPPPEAAAEVMERVLRCGLARLPTVLLEALGDVIPVHHSGYYEIDPRIPRVEEALHPAEFLPSPSAIEAGIRRHGEHPLAVRHAEAGDGVALRISDVMTQDEFRRTPFYAEVNAPVEAEFEMAFRLPGPEPVQVVVVLSRSDRDFTDAERDLCDLLRAPLAAAHALAVRTSLLQDTVRDYAHTDPTAALIACDGDALIPLDTTAEHLLSRLLDPTGTPLPELATWLHDARAGDTVLRDPLPHRHLTTWTDHLGSLEIRHVPGTDGHDLLAVRQLDRDVPTALRALGLRPREAQILELVMAGRTNHDIATRLGITTATVKKHLEGIYRTLDVSTRTAAVAAAYHTLGSPG